MMKTRKVWGLAVVALSLGACDLDLQDPNQPSEGDVLNASGVRQHAIGMQAEFSNEIVDPVYVVGLVTDEIGAIPAAFESFRLVDAGEPVENNVGPSTGPWEGQYDVIVLNANVLLQNVSAVGLPAGTESGIIALAKLYKAMAFGNLLQIYERIPLEVGPEISDATFATRQQGLQTVLDLLGEARTQIQSVPPSDDFYNNVLAPGVDLANTIDAMIARYSLIAGDASGALAAAQRVNLGVLSELRFSASDPNPLWNLFLASNNPYAMRPEDSFRLEAEPGDQRVDYWVTEADIEGSTVPLDAHDRYATRDASFPLYLPDEMRLIQAEVLARQGDLAGALTLVNEVRTQCESELNEPVACLPPLTLLDVPTQEAMLDQILRERRYELYLQGVRWSDLRRFGEPLKYEFMMVSRAECERNENSPADVCALTTQ